MESFNGPRLTTREALLQALFYDLLRDCAPAGTIEHAVGELETLCYGRLSPEIVVFSNKYLAMYAGELADRVEKALKHKLGKECPVPGPGDCECADWTCVGHPAEAYYPLNEHGIPTGHHPDCKHYIPRR